ncbi:MAG: type VI secretion system tube protein Hcp [Nitrosopumilaceae archaeon]
MILTALTSSLLVFVILFSVGVLQKSDAASADYYLEIEGIKGESHVTNCPDCMKVSSWSWGTIDSDYSDVISQLETQDKIPKEFNFTKVTSSASPKLLEAALVGNHFKTGKLLGFEKTPAGDTSFKITFSDILISGYQIATSQTDDSSMDQIIINFSNATVELFSQASTTTTGEISEYQIPSWIKNNAGWWSEGQIDDSDFVKGMEYLIEQGIMKVPKGQSENIQSNKIPSWVKNNAKWWSEGQIDDSDFVKGVQWLISNGLIKVKFPSLPG